VPIAPFALIKKNLSILTSAFIFVLGLVIATAPASAQTWTAQEVSTNTLESLTCLASSSNGFTLIVGAGSTNNSAGSLGDIFISTNAGQTFQPTSAPNNWWTAVACSADGTKIVAANIQSSNAIYTSSDSGNTWTPQSSPVTGGYAAASSADGTKLIVIGTYGGFSIGLFLSSDSGVSWTLAHAGTTNLGWKAVASSADGTHLAATSGGTGLTNYIYLSSDSGNTWGRANVFAEGWSAIASSADGRKIVAVGDDVIYTSGDSGATWQLQPGPPQSLIWSAVASSADGNRLLIGTQESNVPLYSSFDAGLTWVSNNVPEVGCQALASSADGVRLAALPLNVGDEIGTVQLADIDVAVSATPSLVDLQDMIQVTMTIQNETTNTITNVQVNGSVAVNGSGGVSFTGFSGPSVVPTLPPNTNATLIYIYEATNYGLVNFTANVVGNGPLNPIYSLPGLSPNVAIYPKCDLMAGVATTNTIAFQGTDEFQQSPSGDQNLRLSVGASGVINYVVRVQNDSSIAHTFLLTGNTNSAWPDWNIQVLSDNVSILPALTTPGGGWTTPSLDPGAYLDLQVSLAPQPGAEFSGTQSVQINARPDAADDYILDSLLLRAQLVAVPIQVAMQVLSEDALTPDSISAGLSDIDAPLVPVTYTNILASEGVIDGGLVADGVTPLIIQLTANAASLQSFPQGVQMSLQPILLGAGTLQGAPITQRFQVLQNGVWQAATPSTTVTLTSTANLAYFELLPINSDDLLFNGQTNQLGLDFSVVDTNGAQAGDLQFFIRKPPIALVHGYNTPGNWGLDFQTILGSSRPLNGDPADNFIVTVKYGQDTPLQNSFNTPVYVNTVAPLDNCAQMALESLRTNMVPLHSKWAFTRFDVVAHSQGGVLTRMLCNAAANKYIDQPFRNSCNFNRGRFHRIVTIGSPHNGTRLLRYLVDLDQEELLNRQVTRLYTSTLPEIVGLVGVASAIAQAKFDPWGPQFAEVNNPSPSAPWQPDSAALFHLVRATIDNGACPAFGDRTISYLALDLCTATGGQTVIPRGSDGVVDYDSMAANVPPAALGANVFTVDPNNDISHAAPLWVFNSSSYETLSTVIAQHVIDALDQSSNVPSDTIVFGSFSVPPLLSSTIEEGIDNYAVSFIAQAITNLMRLPSQQDDQTNYQYGVTFPTNLPPESSVVWAVQVYGPDGITTDGVELSPSGASNSQVTVTVDDALVGDVVLSGVYMSVSNTVVAISPVLVVSLPLSGPTMTGFQTLPGNIALSVGAAISPVFVANYSDGSTSARYVTAGEINVTSSQPAVVSVSNALYWELSSVGTSQITISWSGFQAASQITVFDPDSTNPPPLSLVNEGNGQLTVSWPGFTTSYQLQSTDDLSNSNSWQTMPTTPLMVGGESLVTLTATNTQQFYRLQWRQ
jgi:hypothetical protein